MMDAPGVCKKAGCARKLAPFIGLPDDVWAYDLSNAPFIIVSNFTIVVYLSRNLKFNCEKLWSMQKIISDKNQGHNA